MIKPRLLLLACTFTAACTDAPAPVADSGASAAATSPAAAAPAENLEPIALRVPDMSCPLCARPIEHRLTELGVRDARADLETKWVTGRFDPDQLSPDVIRTAVEELRFRVAEVRPRPGGGSAYRVAR